MPGNPFTDPNWATDLADTVERVVGKVRSVATDNAVKASRGIVFGTLGLIALLTALPLLVILLLGAFRELLWGFFVDRDTAVYASYLTIGVFFMMIGFLLLKLRHSKEAS
ncbi:MAG: hypothetical protein M9961_06950 [Ilumatobacteraceae bacterium]|nr:hypothetical protein [Ilumatobacter sp.]MCO5329800.1 hypothetical protein [Ilumatobacteraceae bacterium]